MKLYTKEMFLKAAEKCEVSMIDAKHIMKYIDEYVTPIELPSDLFCINCDESKSTYSLCMDCIIKIGKENQIEISDEEIYEKAVFHDGSDYSLGHHNGFIEGAK